MRYIFYLLIWAVSPATAQVDAADTGPYALPHNKVNLEPCNRAAVALHPGVIEVQREQHADGNFRMLYQITMRDGSRWNVSCDLASGKIVRNEKVIG